MRMNNFKKNNIVKDANIKELIEGPNDIKSLNWTDKIKFEKILAIIDSNKFNYKNKISEFKYIDIKYLVNNIRNNTISEMSAKKGLNTLNEIKDAEIIKYKKRTPKHKELLNSFNDLLDTILIDKTLMSSKDKNEKENEKEKGKENENDKTLMSSKDDNENKSEDENDKTLITIKKLNDDLDEIIEKSKSFKDQIKSLRKVENIIEYCHYEDYGDKELEFKYFKIELAHMSNIID